MLKKVTIIISALFLILLIWPGVYEYSYSNPRCKQYDMRTNRFTRLVEELFNGSWDPVSSNFTEKHDWNFEAIVKIVGIAFLWYLLSKFLLDSYQKNLSIKNDQVPNDN